ncbi:MAG: hypothetical protein HY796_11725 [Elusimicrobia bacterium]|nr:hypothetical protein [Elusimicrobiota bacterium]
MGNLTKTSGKLSSIDMDKDFGEAGKVLDGFYTGGKTNGESDSPAVYAESAGQRTLAQAEKEVCNAAAMKIGDLSSKIPPLDSGNDNKQGNSGMPVGAGLLASGAVALAIAGRKKGFWDDVQTVGNAITHPVDTYNDFQNANAYNQSQSHQQSQSNSTGSPEEPFAAHPTDGTPVCVNGQCGLP